jgi:hypothetical protein
VDGRLEADVEPRSADRAGNHSVVPSGILKNAIEFGFADKLAPRIGAAYDVHGDGRLKVFGSYGRYYDWTKYELARGSYGGDVWQVWYRSLDTLDVAVSAPRTARPRFVGGPEQFRDRRVPNFDSTDPDLKPMSQDSFSAGTEQQLGGNQVFGVHFVHNDLIRTIEDIGALDASGNEAYVIGNPGRGCRKFRLLRVPRRSVRRVPKPKRQYDALEFTSTGGWRTTTSGAPAM